MAFNLSQFGEDFFWGGTLHLNPGDDKKPISVAEALCLMPEKKWERMCAAIFPDQDREEIGLDEVMDWVRKVNTCRNLNTPIEVFLDPEGLYTVFVHDRFEVEEESQ